MQEERVSTVSYVHPLWGVNKLVTLLQVKSPENSSVTAIIPAFRSEKVVIRAIESVLSQSSPVDEIIVVDDASDDRTVQVVRDFAINHPQIRLIVNNQNLGPGQSRNAAWNLATSEYLAFLDADDTWHPKKIELQREWFRANPSEVICGTQHCVVNANEMQTGGEQTSQFTIKDLLQRNRFTTPSVMLRRNIPLRFDSKLRMSEDYLLWMEIASEFGHVNRINKPLTILHKPEFGAYGLSSKIRAMYFGEMKALTILNQKNRIGLGVLIRSYIWSTLKLARRLPLALFRKLSWNSKR
jgi:glycosyltransferase involved in cell wall biosynthesis